MPPDHDYSDRLSPFLVKELRAGLRSRGYVVITLLLVTGLAVFTATTLDDEGTDKHTFDIMKGVLLATLTLVMPFLSLDALASERRGKRLEALILSPLTASAVVRGKWFASAVQSGLVATIAIPYYVLGYFSGGFDLTGELAILAVATAAGTAGSAFMLCASGLLREGNTLLNTVVRLVAAFTLLYVSSVATAMTFIARQATELWIVAPVAVAGSLFCAFILIEIAALTLGMNFGRPYRPVYNRNLNTPPPIPA